MALCGLGATPPRECGVSASFTWQLDFWLFNPSILNFRQEFLATSGSRESHFIYVAELLLSMCHYQQDDSNSCYGSLSTTEKNLHTKQIHGYTDLHKHIYNKSGTLIDIKKQDLYLRAPKIRLKKVTYP